jgi:hypothetical protein
MGLVGLTTSYFLPKELKENENHSCTSQVVFFFSFLMPFILILHLQSCPLFHESIKTIGEIIDPREQNDVRKGVLELLSEVCRT